MNILVLSTPPCKRAWKWKGSGVWYWVEITPCQTISAHLSLGWDSSY